ncbi:MAG: hypothetical protein RLZZ444_3266 [Pseudomonadota bacterium]|jgi:hypothetical protein
MLSEPENLYIPHNLETGDDYDDLACRLAVEGYRRFGRVRTSRFGRARA